MDLHTGLPFWLIKDGLLFNYPKLSTDQNPDVVIMGAGMSGALAAYHLTEAGIKSIIVDKRHIGLGSTCASTSLLQYEIDTPLCQLQHKVGLQNAVRSYRLCERSIKKIGQISQKIGFDDFQYRNSLYYAAFKKDITFLKKEFDIRKKHGFDVAYLEENSIKKKFGFSSPGAILSAAGAQTNAYQFTRHLLQYSMKKGLKVYDRTAINKIAHHRNGVSLATDDGCQIKTKKLIYANGYEAVQYIDKKIVDLQSTFACVSEQADRKTSLWKEDVLIWNTADPYLYMRTTDDKRMLIGGRDEKYYSPSKRDEQLSKKIKQLVKDFNKVFPGISFKPEFSWAGTFGATKDGLPYIGNYKKLPNSLFALGFGGNGITFSLIAAEILRDMILGKQNKDADIFSFER